MQEPTGAIRTTTIISVAGRCMKAIGTTKTMAITMTTITIIANLGHSGLQTEGPLPGSFVCSQCVTQFTFAAAESSSPAK